MSRSVHTLLIVEDFLPDRELYRRYLSSDAYDTYRLFEADSAAAGLELCRTQAIDAILLDYSLPDATGLQFLKSLADQTQGNRPPVVMVTGEGDETIAVQAIKLGAEDYLVKRHLTPELLQLAMRNAIENAQLRLQLAQSEARYREKARRLLESEARLKMGVQVAGVALARFDYASDTVELSPEAAILYGIPADQLTISRERIHETFHPDERAILEQIIAEVLDPTGAGWFAREHRVVWQTGEVRWLSVRKQVFFDRSSKIPHPDFAILAAVDVTERKQSEETLRQSEERYRSLSELIPQLVWIADFNGAMLDVNERWSAFTGLTLEQAQTGGWAAIVHPDDLSILAEAWQTAQQEGTPYQAEGRIRRADGLYRWHLHQAMPLKDRQGQIIKWFGTATDIQDLKEIEADHARLLVEAQTARAEAESANRSKDEFVAVVAHELRSPLNSIAGWAKLLQTRKFDPATQEKALDTIWRNTQAQVQLIEDLLDVSRMTRGTLHLTMTPVNLMTVIQSAIDLVLPQARAKEIDLSFANQQAAEPRVFDSPKFQVSGDFNRLQQIVVNLLTNAIKFTPERGRVELELEQVETQVQLKICDNGKGIEPKFLPRIFERFQQGQENTGAKDGLGLGLAIVKHLVDRHQGTITAESAGIGQGATFTVQLPLLQTPLQANRWVSIAEPITLREIRILVVDDEPDMLNLLAFILQEAGAEVETTTSIAVALQQLAQFKPNILISDIAMPEGNGYELVQRMRLYPEGKIPAIALTAYSSEIDEARSLQAGFNWHLTKPVDHQLLIRTIANLVQAADLCPRS
ncbi:MAG: response regulator [Leptolyngbya sp. Prado105]|jgi:PAS domain S-box-containing protein|nr:response regulator [Leptolyngbya sp. Prado105]